MTVGGMFRAHCQLSWFDLSEIFKCRGTNCIDTNIKIEAKVACFLWRMYLKFCPLESLHVSSLCPAIDFRLIANSLSSLVRTRYRLLIWRSSRCEDEKALFSLRKTRRAVLPSEEQIISVNVSHSLWVIRHSRGYELALQDSTWTRPRISGVLSNRQFAHQTRQDKYHDAVLLRGLSK